MRKPRGYGESCPVAHALDLIGDRWAMLVIRELRLGSRRFADLQAALPAIGPTTLTQRLRDLVEVGVLEHNRDGQGGVAYRLTGWGAELEPAFSALARWGARSPVVPLRGPISDDAVMLGVRTFVLDAPPERPAPLPEAEVEVRLSRETYRLRVSDGRLEALLRTTGETSQAVADAVIETDAATIQSLLIGRLTVTAAGTRCAITGDGGLGRWLLGLITPPGHRAPGAGSERA